MQTISYDKTVRIIIVQCLKEFNSQTLSTQAKREEQLVSLTPANKKALGLMGDVILELSTENKSLRSKIGS